jgi:hypothetical protein
VEHRQAPIRVETGALDDGGHRGRQLVVGLAGWVLVVALCSWLALNADELEIRLTLFLVSAAVVIAFMCTSVAVELVRPQLIRDRRREPALLAHDDGRDALGRAVDLDGADVTPEFTISDQAGVRRYGSVGS